MSENYSTTTPLNRLVLEAFGEQGPLARLDAAYRPRAVQLAMATAVVQAIEDEAVLVAEAGTGIGKTYAYLVPALLSDKRCLVSTATKNLQDQLFLRDIPRLRRALAKPFKAALLKGRGSYLCKHRLEMAVGGQAPPDRITQRALSRVQAWSEKTTTGDLSDVPGLDERSPILPWVSSNRDNCLGSDCPQFTKCHLVQARRDALEADVVVVNHHLFFADMVLKDAGLGELLPKAEVLIFDEAHQLSEAGVQFLGRSIGSPQWMDWSRDVLAWGQAQARSLASWVPLTQRLDQAIKDWRLSLLPEGQSQAIGAKWPWSLAEMAMQKAAAGDDLVQAQTELQEALALADGSDADAVRLQQRGQELAASMAYFAMPMPHRHVRWVDIGRQHVRYFEAPLDIAEAIQAQLSAEVKRSWVFTSATLGDEASLDWFCQQSGLGQAKTLRLSSPFDYESHARLWVPAEFPSPKEEQHAEAVADLAKEMALALHGRTFVLTTTLRSLQRIGQSLQQAVGPDFPFSVWVQGQAPKRELLKSFLSQAGSILVGSQSFWEGIDVPGEALQCVIIDKLPFPPPNDPMVQARSEDIEKGGGRPFDAYFLAETAVSLQQGAGRLIRSETDMGLLVICDRRLVSMGYGKRLLRALPPMPRLQNKEDLGTWLRVLKAHGSA